MQGCRQCGFASQSKQCKLSNNKSAAMVAGRVLPLLLLLAVAAPRPNSISIPQTNCIFILNASEHAFTFLACNTPTVTANTDWASCLAECCPGQTPQNPPSQAALTVCRNSLNTTQTISLTSIIIFAVLGVIAVSIISCFCVIVFKLLRSLRGARVSQEAEEGLEIEWAGEEQYLTVDRGQLKWCRKGKERAAAAEATCSICLEDRPNAELYCRHLYHPACIALWLVKSNFCPLCHREDVRAIKVYCQECHAQYVLCRSGFLMANSALIPSNCPACSANKELSGIQEMQCEPSQSLIFELSQEQLLSP